VKYFQRQALSQKTGNLTEKIFNLKFIKNKNLSFQQVKDGHKIIKKVQLKLCKGNTKL